jgi:lipoprotein-anchoring transpeptidase ErfK/SrfK
MAKNRGYNAQKICCDTYKRTIYIHGTNLEHFIPQPLSQGCILLSNADMLDLFDATYEGDYLYITPPHK